MENIDLLEKPGIYFVIRKQDRAKDSTIARIGVICESQPILIWSSTNITLFDTQINYELGLIFNRNNFIKKLKNIEILEQWASVSFYIKPVDDDV